MTVRRPFGFLGILVTLAAGSFAPAAEGDRVNRPEKPGPPDFRVKLETVLKHDDGKCLWFHPRAAAIPGAGRNRGPAVVLTLQKHLSVSDHYSGLSVMRTNDL